MNVHDHLKDKSEEEVRHYCRTKTIDARVAMIRLNGDFNLSTVVRNANFFGFREVIYISDSKRWDRRGSVGTHHYTPMKHFSSVEDFLDAYDDHSLIAVENNIPMYEYKTIDIGFMGPTTIGSKPIFILGEEQCGLDSTILDKANLILTIPGYGSVRSINVGTASGIVMNHYRTMLSMEELIAKAVSNLQNYRTDLTY